MTAETPHRKTILHYDGELDARSLTFSCYQRLPFLSKDRSRLWMMDAIQLARGKHPLHIWAYAIMPEHVHLLVWPHDPKLKIEAVLTTIKQSVSKRALNWLRRYDPAYLARFSGSFHFWQDGPGYDRNLYSPRYIWTDIDYLHENPVRRGLVEKQVDWPWSSAAAYAGVQHVPIPINFESLPEDPRSR
ncbi:MAG: transposase [Pirellulaceae bacterium]